MAKVNNTAAEKIVKGTSKADTITNSGSNVSISAGKGDDSILNDGGSEVLFVYTDGNDFIQGFDKTSTLQIASGKLDSLVKSNGSDYFLTVGENVITLSGAGELEKVSIVNAKGKKVKFKVSGVGTDSPDNFHNALNGTTIKAGAGNDFVSNSGSKVSINAGDGDDYVSTDGARVTVLGSKGNDYVYNRGDNVTISGNAGNDSILNSGAEVLIDGGAGGDAIINDGDNVLIQGNAGNDSISNIGSRVTISAGAGSDTIIFDSRNEWNEEKQQWETINSADNSSADGGAGNDCFYIYEGSNLSLTGGTGNDSIYKSEVGQTKLFYRYEGGNDSIRGFNATDTIQIASSTLGTIKTNGKDFFLPVGENVITLAYASELENLNIVNAKGKAIKYKLDRKIAGTDNDDFIRNYVDKAKITAGDGDDHIYNYYADSVSIDGGEGDDEILNLEQGQWNEEKQEWEVLASPDNATIAGGAGDDSIYNDGNNVLFKYRAGDGDDTINGFNETSTLKILSGKLTSVKTNGTDFFLTVGENSIVLKNLTELKAGSVVNAKGKAIKFTVEEVNTINNSDDRVVLDGSAERDKISNSGSRVTINGGAGDDTVENYGGKVLIDGGAGGDSIKNDVNNVSIFGGAGKDTVENYGSKVTIDTGDGNDSIANIADNVSIVGGSGKDTVENYGSKVTISGGEGDDSIQNNDGSKVLIDGGAGNDDLVNYASNVSMSGSAGSDYIDSYGDNVSIDGGAGNDKIMNSFEYAVDGELMPQRKNSSISGGAGDDTIDNDATNSYIDGGKGNDFIYNTANDVTIAGGAGNDDIAVSGYNVSIDFGAGNDSLLASLKENRPAGGDMTLIGGAGNDYIQSLGEGRNLFVYRAGDGHDTIPNYHESDTIKIADDVEVSTEIIDGDVIITVGDGSINLDNAAYRTKKVTLVDKDDKIISAYTYSAEGIADGKSIKLNASFSGSFDAAAYTEVDGSNCAADIEIVGGDEASTLRGGKGNDTLWGGAQGDKFYGGDGEDTFIVKPAEGKDTIFDYTSSDMLMILNADGSEGGTFTNSSFKSGNLTLALDGGGHVIFQNVSADDSFNINGTSYSIKGSKLK